MDDSYFKQAFCRSSIIVELILLASAIVFVTSVCVTCHRNINSENRNVVDYPYFTNIEKKIDDPMVDDRVIIRELWNNQKNLDSMRTDLLSDVRQETNNSIEKISSQLSFWVAVIALIGVFTPIAISLKEEKDLKDRFEEKDKALDNRFKLYVNDAEYKLKKATDLAELKKEIKKSRSEVDLEMCLSSLISIRSNRMIESDADLREAYIYLSKSPIDHYLHFFQEQIDSTKDINNGDIKHTLLKMSFQVYEILRNLTYDHDGHTRPRFLYKGEESIKELIKELMKERANKQELQGLLNKVDKNIGIILYRIKDSETFPK